MPTTIADLCDDVLNEYQVAGRSSTNTIEYRIRCHIKRLIGGLIAADVETRDLLRYAAARQKEGAANGTDRPPAISGTSEYTCLATSDIFRAVK